MAGLVAGAAPSVTIESAQQRAPWSGIVDIECTVKGINIKGTGTNYMFACKATNKSTGVALSVSAVTVRPKAPDGLAAVSIGDFFVTTNGVYHLSWDTTADLGAASIDAVRFNVLLRLRPQRRARGAYCF